MILYLDTSALVPRPRETGEAVLGPLVRPEVLRHSYECPSSRRDAFVLIWFAAEPDPDREPH